MISDWDIFLLKSLDFHIQLRKFRLKFLNLFHKLVAPVFPIVSLINDFRNLIESEGSRFNLFGYDILPICDKAEALFFTLLGLQILHLIAAIAWVHIEKDSWQEVFPVDCH